MTTLSLSSFSHSRTIFDAARYHGRERCSSPRLMLAAHLHQQLLDIDIDLACRADVADLKAVAVLDEPDFLDRDAVLTRVVDPEPGRWRPDVAGVAIAEVTALVHMTAGDEAQIDARKHLDQSRARWLRHVA